MGENNGANDRGREGREESRRDWGQKEEEEEQVEVEKTRMKSDVWCNRDRCSTIRRLRAF